MDIIIRDKLNPPGSTPGSMVRASTPWTAAAFVFASIDLFSF
ncbi:MAG: hypothetical protein ABJB16_04375 [Saprospiraceae bacterium]